MNRKKTALIIISFLSVLTIQAQILSKDILSNYPAGVITKLYQIAKTIPITDSQQVKLARAIDFSDNNIAENIRQGKSAEEIDRLKLSLDAKIYLILGKDVMSYTAKEAENFSSIASNGEMNYVQTSYRMDSVLSNRLRAIQYNKYKSMYQQFLLFHFSDDKATERMETVSKKYDSLSFAMYPTMFSTKYLNGYMDDVKKIKPTIADSTVQKIRKSFYALTSKNMYVDWGTTLMEVMQHVYPDTAVFAHFYGAAIDRQATTLATAEKYKIVNVDHVSKYGFDSIFHLIKQKNYQQVLLEYTYAGNPKMRDTLLSRSSKYFDSTITASLMRDGSLLSSSQFAIALKYRHVLELRPTLIDTLVQYAMYVKMQHDSLLMKDPFAKSDSKVYEAQILNELLTEDQYTKLLMIKNKSQVDLDTNDDWDDMEKWGLAANLNKDATIKQLHQYYMVKWNAYYRMANDKIKQEANLKLLKDNQPKALKMLSAAKKQPNPVNDNTKLNLSF